MKTSEKIAKITKFAGTAAVKTATSCGMYMGVATPIAITATAAVNKITSGAFNLKGAVTEVVKDAAITLITVTAINTAIAAATATTATINGVGIFADDKKEEVVDVDDFEWDDEEA